jgi:Phasin protein
MSSRSQSEGAINGNPGRGATMLFGPALTFSVWEPIIAGALKANAQAQETLGPIAGEWQAFVGHRLQEDMALMQRLAKSRTPTQSITAYAVFWQKAAEDYGKEFATITELMGRATSKVARASQGATGAVSWQQLPWQKVAA